MLNFQPYQFDTNLRRDRGGYTRDPVYAGGHWGGPDRSWRAEFTRVYRGLRETLENASAPEDPTLPTASR